MTNDNRFLLDTAPVQAFVYPMKSSSNTYVLMQNNKTVELNGNAYLIALQRKKKRLEYSSFLFAYSILFFLYS